MAQQNTATTDNSDKSKNPRPTPLSMPRQRLASSETTSSLSPAELYINQKSQMLFDSNDSPVGASSASSTTSSVKHKEKMHEWHEKQVNELYKQEPHRYKYGTPPSSTFRRDNSSANSKTKK